MHVVVGGVASGGPGVRGGGAGWERTWAATRAATSEGSSCDQNRMIVHPACCRVVVWLSRAVLVSILAFQWARLEAGGV
ncbi:hypothetical protein [Streptosporangium roseum]|uniref:hypothetical protein n=1 Tax=Streptosporangium roseum TaxID=2001 RepID=UPI003320DF7A